MIGQAFSFHKNRQAMIIRFVQILLKTTHSTTTKCYTIAPLGSNQVTLHPYMRYICKNETQHINHVLISEKVGRNFENTVWNATCFELFYLSDAPAVS